MKVAELTGEALDFWVAEAEGMLRLIAGTRAEKLGGYSPSTNWAKGGPLIQRELMSIHPMITLDWVGTCDPLSWYASIPFSPTRIGQFEGETPLIAAMRCFVASKFGDEVPDEVTP